MESPTSRDGSAVARPAVPDTAKMPDPARGASVAARFVVRVTRVDDVNARVIARGPAGSAEALVALPRSEDLYPRPSPNGSGDDAAEGWANARRAGVALFNVLFPPAILRLLESSRQAVDEDEPLPLDLILDDAETASLPWELLRDPDTDRFVALSQLSQFSRVAPGDAGPPPNATIGNLRVQILSAAIGESMISAAQALGADERVTLSFATAGTETKERPHVVQLEDVEVAGAARGTFAPVVVAPGNADVAGQLLSDARIHAVLAVPTEMPPQPRTVFLARFYAEVADGEPVDRAVTLARRAVADLDGAGELAWSLPVLVTRGVPAVVTRPRRAIAGTIGSRAAEHTVGWVRDTLSGVVSSVALFLAGLLLYRFGFSQSPEFSLSILSPFELYNSFKGLIVEISTYQEYFLLGAAAVLLAGVAASGWLWWRNRRVDPVEQSGLAWEVTSRVGSLRAVSFLAVLALVVIGAFAYQQYLWRVLLPIDADDVGIAITREAAAASFRDELADALFTEGQAQRITVRELPVRFDARDTEKARDLGRRIGAEAVIIYRSDESGGSRQYVAYVVFTDPKIGLAVGGEPSETDPATDDPATAGVVTVREGVAVPVLRTETLSELVDAAAGIIAYNDDRSREAILHLEQAVPGEPDAPNNGVVNFYLGSAYADDSQGERAAAAFERAIDYFEQRLAAGEQLGPQDQLILAKSYFGRGRVEWFRSEVDAALAWYDRAVALREDLVARAGGLERPGDVHATYARLYAEMAEAYRFKQDAEQEAFWDQRSRDEADAILNTGDPDDPQVYIQQSAARFFSGDCVGALEATNRALAIDPDNIDALNNSATIYFGQSRTDLAEQTAQRILEMRPTDISVRQLLANLAFLRVLGDGDYFEPAYISEIRDYYHEIIRLDPSNLEAHDELAELADFLGSTRILDATALYTGDDVSVAKSQALWRNDVARRTAAIEAYGEAIAERRILAVELRPGSVDAQLDLAGAYFKRQELIYGSLYSRFLAGKDDTFEADGEQVLADAAQIHEWTAAALDPASGATRAQQLLAWQLRLQSLDREWGWHFFYTSNTELAAEKQAAYVQTANDAVAAVGAEPIRTTDEKDPAVIIYLAASFVASAIEEDAAKGEELRAKYIELAGQAVDERVASNRHVSTICTEERERAAGDDRIAEGDIPGAVEHYEAALAANPQHVPSLVGLADALHRQGDSAGAIANATAATEAQPELPSGWEALGRYQLLAGDTSASDAAYGRFFDIVSTLPPQERMATLDGALQTLTSSAQDDPAMAASVAGALPDFVAAIDAIGASGEGTYQYPRLYALAATATLYAGDAAEAERLASRAVELDAYQVDALLLRALAAIAQGRDAAAETEAAITVTRDEMWAISTVDGPMLLTRMEQAATQFAEAFPEHAEAVATIVDAIDAERANAGS